ncbi:sensor histidine kinase [Bifidobacterium moukalabense]|uniref:sensor histidine kinase n=1 Tax=Bifidobacterium moukalabense TaxID=1333651 RepID=UPI0010F4353F|nr:sensor histidine kinase [Bifidobacterium moukalabense]
MIDVLNLPSPLLCGIAVEMALTPAVFPAVGFRGARPRNGARPEPPSGSRVTWYAGIVIGLALSLAIAVWAKETLIDFNTNSTALEAPICLAILVAFALVALRNGVTQGVYEAIWAQVIASLSFECMDCVTMWLPDPARVVALGLLTPAVCVALFVVVRVRLLPQLRNGHAGTVGKRKLLFAATLCIMFLLLSNYQVIFLLLGSRDHTYMIPAFRIMVELLGLITLYLQNDIEQRQHAQMELSLVQRLWQSKQRQYEISKETIDLINRKCHDLKYQLAAFRTMQDDAEVDRRLGEVEQSVMIYDSAVQTGNRVLDVVLTEKSLYCEAEHITLTCMVDGAKLDFIDQADLYALFGNALDNAIESVTKQRDPAKRVIQVSVYPDNGFLMIRIRNYCDEPITLADGLPVTSKKAGKGYHGYGLRGIRYTAEKYGGTMNVKIAPDSFTLQVVLPLN